MGALDHFLNAASLLMRASPKDEGESVKKKRRRVDLDKLTAPSPSTGSFGGGESPVKKSCCIVKR